MKYIEFEGANTLFRAPESMKDTCGDLPALATTDDNGYRCIVSAWQPSEADKAAIAAGQPIFLKIVGEGMPPVCLFTITDNIVNP
jgi:hypothetical protein